jgi:hypothetical protein
MYKDKLISLYLRGRIKNNASSFMNNRAPPHCHTFITYNLIHATTTIPSEWFPLVIREIEFNTHIHKHLE